MLVLDPAIRNPSMYKYIMLIYQNIYISESNKSKTHPAIKNNVNMTIFVVFLWSVGDRLFCFNHRTCLQATQSIQIPP